MTRQKGLFLTLLPRFYFNSLSILNKREKNVVCPILVLYLPFSNGGCMSQRVSCFLPLYALKKHIL